MVVFANLAGNWIELGDDDYVENEPAEIFVAEKLLDTEFHSLNNFLKVSHGDLIYNIHISQIQWANDRY